MISFVIPYKYLSTREGRIEKCIEAIKNLNGYDYTDEIIVADLSREPHYFEEVKVVHEYKDIWCRALACNLGVKQSKNRFVVVVDIDIILPKNFKDKAVQHDLSGSYMVFDTYENGKCRQPGFEGYCILFDKELWQKLGGYDEDFVGYGGEDIDFRERLDKIGANRIHKQIKLQHIPHDKVEIDEDGNKYGWDIDGLKNVKMYEKKNNIDSK